ncbi:CD1108 family mobile element protein [Senegalia sp. (in: firmicutes)]|uniref:CD1108 family mobile element protein n=1 Tax=Senegalia sp. (in: firmicutes) TaxID=1924098 RepID=UPI003F99437A
MKEKNERFKSKDKIILKNSKDGLIEENLSKGTTTNISNKVQDIDISKLKENQKEQLIDYRLNKDKNNYKKPKESLTTKSKSRKKQYRDSKDAKDINSKSEESESNIINKSDKSNFEDEMSNSEDLSVGSNISSIKDSTNIGKSEKISKSSDKSKHPNDIKTNRRSRFDKNKTNKDKFKKETYESNKDIKSPKTEENIGKINQIDEIDNSPFKAMMDERLNEIESDNHNESYSYDELENIEDKINTGKGQNKKDISNLNDKKKTNRNKTKSKTSKTKLKFQNNTIKNGKNIKNKESKNSLGASITGISKRTNKRIANLSHSKISDEEEENLGVKSLHKTELVLENSLKKGKQFKNYQNNRKIKKLKKFERENLKNKEKLDFNKVLKSNKKYTKGNSINKFFQKRRIKKEYNKKKYGGIGKRILTAIKGNGNTASYLVKKLSSKAINYVVALFLLAMLIIVISNAASTILLGGMGVVSGSSYQAGDLDVTGADIEYSKLEANLLKSLKNIEKDYPGYDEYRYYVDAVGHNPHDLIAYLTAKYGDFRTDNIADELDRIFRLQYEFFTKKIIKKYTTTESFTDSNTGETYDIEVEKSKVVLETTLRSKPLNEVIKSQLDRDEKELYEILMKTKGNYMTYPSPIEGDWKQKVSSMFGYRIHPIKDNLSMHKGLDIADREGTPLKAIFDGVVTKEGFDSDGYGRYLVITNEKGYSALYAHCLSVDVNLGDKIKKESTLAKMGSTGNSTGSHLHLELKDKNGNLLNPYFYLLSDSDETPSGTMEHFNGYDGSFNKPGIAFDNETARILFAEAEKHLGKRYVFGANGPNNFDCSSFVCWSFTKSNVYNLPRTTAQGIFNKCTPIKRSDAKAGDLIFFRGTYNTSNTVTHIGIYAGNGMMIHAGDPIQYANIDTNYWRNHFYAFGRLR